MSDEAVPKGLLTSAEIAAIEQPIERARTLPRRAFFDPAFYEFEVRHWLSRTWIAVAFGDRIASSGDARPLTVLGQPLMLVRGSDRRVRAFHNVVPYDGCEVLLGAAVGLSEIVTPYHGISYDLEGRFIRAPYWNGTPGGGEVVAAGDLRPLRCAEWLGTIFLNLDGAAEPFEGYLEPVTTFYREYQLERLRVGCDEQGNPVIHELECRANWKTMYENYSPNVYHERFVHEMYRKSPDSPRVDRDGQKTYREILDERGFLGLAYDNKNADSFYGAARALPPLLRRDGSPTSVNSIVNMYPTGSSRGSPTRPGSPSCCPKDPNCADNRSRPCSTNRLPRLQETQRRGVVPGMAGSRRALRTTRSASLCSARVAHQPSTHSSSIHSGIRLITF